MSEPPDRCTNCGSEKVEQDPNFPDRYDCMDCGMPHQVTKELAHD